MIVQRRVGCCGGYGDPTVDTVARVIMQPIDAIVSVIRGQQEGGAARVAAEAQRAMEQQQERASVTKYAIVGGAIIASMFVFGLVSIKAFKRA